MQHRSATTELAQTRRVVRSSRPHDHIYDPVYTVGNQSVHLQASHTAAMEMGAVEKVPVQSNMFSDNQRFPRHLYRMKQSTVRVPVFPPKGKPRATPANDIVARSRMKFFTRPVLPFLQAVPAQVLVAPSSRGGNEQGQGGLFEDVDQEHIAEEPRLKSVGIQSQYRESSAQTEPYTRDYITAEGETEPEILSIAHLTFGAGLPASLDEINLIHRMREKRKFEASLPPVTDEASFQQRKKMLEERELKEWELREEAMKQEQEAKLQQLISTLKAREEKKEALSDARVEMVRQEKIKQRDRVFAKIHHDRIKVHRGLGKQRKTYGAKKDVKRDIILEHTQYNSKVYAPNARDGRLAVKNQVVDYGIPLINNYQGLLALEKSVNKRNGGNQGTVQVKKPAKILLKHEKSRKGQKILNDLAYCNDLLQHSQKQSHEKKIENVYKKFEPVLRAHTPRVEVPADDEQQRAILLLQRLIRGRAVQNKMYQGKERSLHLIRELRLAENATDVVVSEAEVTAKAEATALDTLQGEVVSKALDFVTKEIQRMQQESRVAHLVSQATDTRRRREAEEAGRRQAEYLNRKKREEYHAALMRENSASAGRFLDEIFDVAVETVSGKQAGEGTIVNSTMDSMVQTIEDEENDAATVVTDLLSQFLFPELARRQEKAVAQVEDRKYIDAAHNIVCNLVGAVAEKTANGEEKPTTRRGRSRTRGMSVSARNRSSSTR